MAAKELVQVSIEFLSAQLTAGQVAATVLGQREAVADAVAVDDVVELHVAVSGEWQRAVDVGQAALE